jgi:hypothetical protein
MPPLRLAVDFDGVCHDPENVAPGYKMGRPIPGAVDAMNQLKADGTIIVIHSVWADTEQKRKAMSEWLRFFNIPYDFITNTKPDCDLYIDNKGYHFINWSDTLAHIKTLTPGS